MKRMEEAIRPIVNPLPFRKDELAATLRNFKPAKSQHLNELCG